MLTIGPSIPAAFLRMYFLEHACSAKMAGAALNADLSPIDAQVQSEVRARYSQFRKTADFGQLEWRSLLRMLERQGVQYRH